MQSCALLRPTPSQTTNSKKSPFFDDISISLNSKSSEIEKEGSLGRIVDNEKSYGFDNFQSIEYIPSYTFRYAILLDLEVEKLTNRRLVEYINQWWGVPYRVGGNSMDGIDCSAFVKGLASDAFKIDLPRTSREQADFCKKIEVSELQEGDLVFFSTGRSISHVGLYISNNKFVHASTSMGVIISDLNEPYWSRRFVKAGRMQN
jgi:lipoprotein Spr